MIDNPIKYAFLITLLLLSAIMNQRIYAQLNHSLSTEYGNATVLAFDKYFLKIPSSWRAVLPKTGAPVVFTYVIPGLPSDTITPERSSSYFNLLFINSDQCDVTNETVIVSSPSISMTVESHPTNNVNVLRWTQPGLIEGEQHWCIVASGSDFAIEIMTLRHDTSTVDFVDHQLIPSFTESLRRH